MKFSEFCKKVGVLETETQEEKDLKAVRADGCALRYIQNQTPEICMEAVKKDGRARIHVKNKIPEICIEAVKQNKDAMKYVDKSIFEEE